MPNSNQSSQELASFDEQQHQWKRENVSSPLETAKQFRESSESPEAMR